MIRRLPLLVIQILAILAGVTHAKTDWLTLTPDSGLNTATAIYTIGVILATIAVFEGCIHGVRGKHAELGPATFVVLVPGVLCLLALYSLRTYFLIHYSWDPNLSRAFYAMLYFTEHFSNILIAAFTMFILYSAESDWYQNGIIQRVRNWLRLFSVVAWLALVVAETIKYRPPPDVAHNAIMTIALSQGDRLSNPIIGLYNFVTLDIAISLDILGMYARQHQDRKVDPDYRITEVLFVTRVLAVRSLALLVVHVLSLVSIPAHLVRTIAYVISVGWLIVIPFLCTAALLHLFRARLTLRPVTQVRRTVTVVEEYHSGVAWGR